MNVLGVPEQELKSLIVHVDQTLTLTDTVIVDARTLLTHLVGIVSDLHALTTALRVKVVSDKG